MCHTEVCHFIKHTKICHFIKHCLGMGKLPLKLNHILITLVPKQPFVTVMNHIRPLTLWAYVHLFIVVAKIIVAKLRPLLPKLVNPVKTSFMLGCYITNNMIITQELLHKYSQTKGKLGFLAWKIDLSKAYDRPNWDFHAAVLWEIGVSGTLYQLVLHCITSVTFQEIINGELTTHFSPQCSLCQGDPLSPFLFVLCLEKLSHSIDSMVHAKLWKPVRASRSDPLISHLFFEDDLILFAEATTTQIHILK